MSNKQSTATVASGLFRNTIRQWDNVSRLVGFINLHDGLFSLTVLVVRAITLVVNRFSKFSFPSSSYIAATGSPRRGYDRRPSSLKQAITNYPCVSRFSLFIPRLHPRSSEVITCHANWEFSLVLLIDSLVNDPEDIDTSRMF